MLRHSVREFLMGVLMLSDYEQQKAHQEMEAEEQGVPNKAFFTDSNRVERRRQMIMEKRGGLHG